MTIGTRLWAKLKGELVGEDAYGNRYFQERGEPRGRWRRRRCVLYEGRAEASKVPPEWHAWLHYTVDLTPVDEPPTEQPWQKPHVPNLTGTGDAYRPPGDLSRGRDAKVSGAYEPWVP